MKKSMEGTYPSRRVVSTGSRGGYRSSIIAWDLSPKRAAKPCCRPASSRRAQLGRRLNRLGTLATMAVLVAAMAVMIGFINLEVSGGRMGLADELEGPAPVSDSVGIVPSEGEVLAEEVVKRVAADAGDPPARVGVLLSNTCLVLAVALTAVVVSECVAWAFVYRTAEYGTLLAGVGNSWRKLQEMKDPRRRTGPARIKSQDSIFQERNRKLSSKRMIAGFLSSVVYLVLLPSFKRTFHGLPVLQLPFQPIWFVKSLAFHSLPESDTLLNYGSAMFLYVLAVGFFRANIQKIMGYSPPPSIAANSGLAAFLTPPAEPEAAALSPEPRRSAANSRSR